MSEFNKQAVNVVAESRPPLPPFNNETARAKVQAAEDAWNTCNPEKVAQAYTQDSVWRNRSEFITGRDQIQNFLSTKWNKELDYRLKKELWAHTDNRIAVTFFYEWRNEAGEWFRAYGNELWQFANNGLMERRIASINDVSIKEEERKLR